MTNQYALGLESAGSSQQTMTTGNYLEILSWQIYILHVQNSVLETVGPGMKWPCNSMTSKFPRWRVTNNISVCK